MKLLPGVALAFNLLISPASTAQDVVVLGEIHDNPAHHRIQAQRVAGIAPKALVFEMISPDRFYGEVVPAYRSATGLQDYLEWESSGWPDFAMYRPIFDAAPDARIYGAHVARDTARQAMSTGVAAAFGEGAGLFGLNDPLSADQQAARDALQAAAHCDALPAEMLPAMVDIQRLRDATLARAARDAMQATGGPVAVITGNGHARKDWGMPALLALAAPELDIHVLGQTEDNAPLAGEFDEVISSPAHPRPDPCLAFQ